MRLGEAGLVQQGGGRWAVRSLARSSATWAAVEVAGGIGSQGKMRRRKGDACASLFVPTRAR